MKKRSKQYKAVFRTKIDFSRDYWRGEEMRWDWSVNSNVKKRDAFSYYLLVANIVLLVIVGVLVFGAVKAVYFI